MGLFYVFYFSHVHTSLYIYLFSKSLSFLNLFPTTDFFPGKGGNIFLFYRMSGYFGLDEHFVYFVNVWIL